MNTLRISLFGEFSARTNETEVLQFSPTCLSLFAFLLYRPQQTYPRDILLEHFWADSTPEQGRRCLNTALWRLRKHLESYNLIPDAYLRTTTIDQISFNWNSDYWLDVEHFLTGTAELLQKPVLAWNERDADDISKIVELYRGNLLEGIYDDWAIRERENYRRALLQSLTSLMEYYTNQNSYIKAIHCGERLLAYDPVREDIHRAIMRLYIQNGQPQLAMQQYSHCCTILEEELQMVPMPETQYLHSQLLSDSPIARTPTTTDAHQIYSELKIAQEGFHHANMRLQNALDMMQALMDESPINRSSTDI